MTTRMHSDLESALLRAMGEMETIDCHEHLGPERDRTGAEVDVFTLFSHYTRGDLLAAGMSEDQYRSLFDRRRPLDERWAEFQPFWEIIRWTSYARAARLAAARFYGADDINAATCQALSEAIRRANTPGLYERVLGEACRIRAALSVRELGDSLDFGNPRLRPVVSIAPFHPKDAGVLAHPPFVPGFEARTLDDFLEAMRLFLAKAKERGAPAIKAWAYPVGDPDASAARSAFADLLAGRDTPADPRIPLSNFLFDRAMAMASELDLAISIHTGYWGDFRRLDPLHLIPVFQRHPRARFDVFHLGFPWVRETLLLGKTFPNVWINLCWTHVISQQAAAEALDEAIDLLPANKLLAFGGDYGLPVEKVYAHLVMAREDIARALAARIESGQFTEAQALALARRWLFDNPAELYRLKV